MRVKAWLATYKFGNWLTHSSSGAPVTDKERHEQAEKIAHDLCDHGRWLTHGRSIKIADLQEMGLQITDLSADADLHDAVQRYYTLLQMSFGTNIYKIFETPRSQILRFEAQAVPIVAEGRGSDANVAFFEVKCANCAHSTKVQANLGKNQPLKEGCVPFPDDSRLKCPQCGSNIDLAAARREIEAQAKRPIVTEAP